jgi:CDP-diacylglycerol--serine O-phosphatidyltransferase
MNQPAPQKPKQPEAQVPQLKIYFLPNLLTASNLFCGFVALTKIVNVDYNDLALGKFDEIYKALFYILLACIFDLFDGRVARMGGRESPFGREFDSLADLISFGVAPAFLVHRVVFRDVFVQHQEIGWFISSIYLICGAFRLARFNCLAAMAGTGGGKEFLGFPIPSAAGLVASLTLLMMRVYEKDFVTGKWRFLLPALMIFLSWMMVSEVKYPTFKGLDLKATRTFTKTLLIIMCIPLILIFQERLLVFALPVFFISYLIYGFVRPFISKKMRADIEDEENEDIEQDGGNIV